MEILFVGSEADCSLERWYAVHLKEAGVEVELFPTQSIFFEYYRKSLVNKLIFKAGLSSIYQRMDRMLREAVNSFKPDIVWIFKGMEVYPSFLSWLKGKGIRSVNFNPDNPFIFSGRGSGNRNVTESIGLYDLHFSYDRVICDHIEKEYRLPCQLLPFGHDLRDDVYEICVRQKEEREVCFLGNPDRDRADFVLALAERCAVNVYGHDWDRYVRHSGVKVYGPAYGDDFWKVLYRYRVQLNLHRPHNLHSHNMRSFEIPAVGGIGLFPDTPDHRLYFEDRKEVFLYKNMAECADLAYYLLNISEEEALRIRKAARLRSITGNYSYKERIAAVLPILASLNA
jgi:spore maturation protein CgeB